MREDVRARVQIENIDELEAWLRDNHGQRESVWLVTWKKNSGGRYVPGREVLETLLCHGWIDGLRRKVDDERTMLLISPRRARSNWSRLNRQIAEELIRRGKMKKPGRAAIESAKRDGRWNRLDEVEDLVIPDDLAAALADKPGARVLFDGFPPSSRRGILEWIQSAKRSETRARRIAETAEKAAKNIKANFPVGRDRGPAVKPRKQRRGGKP